MSNDLSIFAPSFVVGFADKKGNMHTISAEGALFKGGAAVAALKDEALDSALAKAHNGKYRAAADILSVAFPSQAKAFAKLFNVAPEANKTTMHSFVHALSNAEAPAKGWSKKQVEIRTLLSALHNVPSLMTDEERAAADVARTIEMA
jgi:hypothetical protein